MSLPTFDLEPAPSPAPRWFVAWALLIALFGLLIGLGVADYLAPKSKKDEQGALNSQLLRALKISIIQAQLARFGSPQKNGFETSTLEPILDKYPTGSVEGAEARVVIAILGQRKPKVGDVALLASGTKNEKLLSQLPGANRDEARRIAQELEPTTALQVIADRAATGMAVDKGPLQYAHPPERTLVFGLFLFAVVGAFGLGCVLWALYLVRRAQGIRPAGHPLENAAPADADRLAMRSFQMIFAFFGGQTLFGIASMGMFPKELSGVRSLLAFLAGGLLAFSFSGVPVREKLISLRDLGWGRFQARHLAYALAGLCMNLPLLILTLPITSGLSKVLPEPSHPATELLSSNTSIANIVATLVAAAILAPIFEETMFRGALYGAIRNGTRSFAAGLLVTNLLFAAVHPTGIPAWISLAAIGVTCTLLTLETRSLYPAMLFHGFHNASLLVMVTLMS